MNKLSYFNCYFDSETLINHLSDEQAGQLWKMLFAYANRNEESEINDELLSMAFDIFRNQMDRDFKKYADKCEQNRKNRQKALDRQQSSTVVDDR